MLQRSGPPSWPALPAQPRSAPAATPSPRPSGLHGKATSSSSPARAMKPARSSATRSCPSTTRSWPASARREREYAPIFVRPERSRRALARWLCPAPFDYAPLALRSGRTSRDAVMNGSLWTSDEIAAATGGAASTSFEVTGVTFDSREVQLGDLFIAMPGTVHDGHRFVDGAFAAGAAGAIVSQPVAGPHILVADTAAALEALGRASRQRTQAVIFGVTGSVGKTSTKEALFAALDRTHPGKVHRSVKSYNNHTGVPLSLARMPRECDYAVLEMGMNNAGEIAALTRQVRPNVALIMFNAPATTENLGSEEAIADAKAEIFEGLEPDGVAIIPNDTPHRDRLVRA